VEKAVASPKDSRKHVPLWLLWTYARDIGSLSFGYMEHVLKCEDCLEILDICLTGQSIEEVRRIVEEGRGYHCLDD
jgi:hypothetical protein